METPDCLYFCRCIGHLTGIPSLACTFLIAQAFTHGAADTQAGTAL
jgi:hypothetical protein